MSIRNFYLEEGQKTPKIELNYEKGYLSISGRSIPENSIEFYRPLIEWVYDYASKPQEHTIMDVRLEYFNTSSSKCLIEVFRTLEVLYVNGKDVTINWYYEEDDEDMQESGEDFREVIKIPMEMIPYEDEQMKDDGDF